MIILNEVFFKASSNALFESLLTLLENDYADYSDLQLFW